MLNTFVRPVMVGVSTLCFVTLSAILPEKILAVEPAQSMALLLPLEARSLSIEPHKVALDRFADTFNAQMNADRAIAANPMGTFLESLPLLSNFVDETGNLNLAADIDMDLDLPISVDVGSVMGATGLVLSTDFTLAD
jgi:hypothetical protein